MSKTELFIEELQKLNPSFKVKFKDESSFMKVLSKILFFNKGFMTEFVTTIGSTVYFPSRKRLEERGDSAAITLAHEYVHVSDAKRNFLFPFLYLIPISLLPVALLLMFHSWILGLILFLLCLAPLPAPFRKMYEMRGYTMSLFMFDLMKQNQIPSIETRRHYLYELSGHFNKHFTGPNYYFMWPMGVQKDLQKKADKIVAGSIYQEDKVYSEMKSAALKSGII